MTLAIGEAPSIRENETNGLPRLGFLVGFGFMLAATALLVSWRYYDPDEFEHLQFAWLIQHGTVPYRDFFEHHTPLYHFLVAPLLMGFDDRDPSTAWNVLTLLRSVAVVISILFTGLSYLIGRRLFGNDTALLAVALLICNDFYLNKIIEIRPDQLGVLGLLMTAYALLRAFSSEIPGRSRVAWLFLAGLAAASAVLATQKALFAMPGFAAAYGLMAWRRIDSRIAATGVVAVLAGASAVAGTIMVYFSRHGALDVFIEDCFLLNAGWPSHYHGALLRWGRWGLTFDTLFWLLVAAGTTRATVLLIRNRASRHLWTIVGPLATLAAGSFAVPVVQRQYFLLLIPFAAILAAPEATRLISLMSGRRGGSRWAPVLLPGILGLYGALHVSAALRDIDHESVAELGYVLNSTPPDATIMAGFSPSIAFRMPAWKYFFFHKEMLPLMERRHWDGLLEGLQSGAIRPEIIDYDHDLHLLPQDFKDFVEIHYAPIGIGTLWRRID